MTQLEAAVTLFRAFCRGVAGSDGIAKYGSKEKQAEWVEQTVREFEQNVKDMSDAVS